jgi:hypothetical protein
LADVFDGRVEKRRIFDCATADIQKKRYSQSKLAEGSPLRRNSPVVLYLRLPYYPLEVEKSKLLFQDLRDLGLLWFYCG